VAIEMNTSPVTLNGTVSDPAATVNVNGIVSPQSAGKFSVAVPLIEGNNTITVVAQNAAGRAGTGSVQVTLDTTPPHVTIRSPANDFVTTDVAITVSGIVNDIVVGTVNDQQAQVTVNGVSAQVLNRAFTTANIPLSLGPNTIQATARDRSGNAATTSVNVIRQASTGQTNVEPRTPTRPSIHSFANFSNFVALGSTYEPWVISPRTWLSRCCA